MSFLIIAETYINHLTCLQIIIEKRNVDNFRNISKENILNDTTKTKKKDIQNKLKNT